MATCHCSRCRDVHSHSCSAGVNLMTDEALLVDLTQRLVDAGLHQVSATRNARTSEVTIHAYAGDDCGCGMAGCAVRDLRLPPEHR